MPDINTIAAQRKSGRERLREHSVQPDRDMEALLCDLLGLSRAQLITEDRQPLNADQLNVLQAQIERLERGEPLAYIRGQQEFWSLTLNVTPDVLIPRPDTERLVEVALARLSHLTRARVLELGTGSGAVALALASERPLDTIVATDISENALRIARSNLHDTGFTNVTMVQSDWYQHLAEPAFDLIVSNPPYIDTRDSHVDRSVSDHEPSIALYADNDGLAAIAAIADGAQSHLRPGGWVMVEHGWQQHLAVTRCFQEHDLDTICSHRDLAGHYRVTEGKFS